MEILVKKGIVIGGKDRKVWYQSSGHEMNYLYHNIDSLKSKTPPIVVNKFSTYIINHIFILY